MTKCRGRRRGEEGGRGERRERGEEEEERERGQRGGRRERRERERRRERGERGERERERERKRRGKTHLGLKGHQSPTKVIVEELLLVCLLMLFVYVCQLRGHQ